MVSGHDPDTTNNRMEIMAVIKGLEATPAGSTIVVYSDSQYVVNTMSRGWRRKANQDLWQRLDTLADARKVSWEWVKGHAGHPENEEADAMANREAHKQGKALTVGLPISSSKNDVVPSGDTTSPSLTHLDRQGEATMVDVGEKNVTRREAVACCFVAMKPETLALIKKGQVAKGDVFAVARLAGIMGAKQTPHLIPLCHTIPLDQVTVELQVDDDRSGVDITASASTSARTGVEMEALTAVTVAALTLYDMCKSVDRGIRIEGVRLVSKRGGKSGDIVLE